MATPLEPVNCPQFNGHKESKGTHPSQPHPDATKDATGRAEKPTLEEVALQSCSQSCNRRHFLLLPLSTPLKKGANGNIKDQPLNSTSDDL